MKNIDEQLELIKNRISDKDFLSNKGLSNEIGFHFFCYDPKYEMRIRNYIKKLKDDKNIKIIKYDLYHIFLDILESKRILKNVASVEEKKGKEYLLTQIQKIATPDAFVEKMKYDNHKFGDVVILSGVGKVFPYMRSHNLLESMQLHFCDVPVLVFYPGEYDGISPNLFGKFIDGHYYRAFNLL